MVATADGYTTTDNEQDLLCGCSKAHPTFSDTWLRKVVVDTGERYRYPTGGSGEERATAGGKSMLPMDKLQVPGVLP